MIKSIKTIEFFGNINDTVNVSGVQTFGDLLLLVTDEKNTIPVLKKIGDGSQYELIHYLALQDDDEDEIDIEDIACQDQTFFAIGSHALTRKKVKEDKSYQKNRKRIEEVTIVYDGAKYGQPTLFMVDR